jgi:hypothetical protein
LEFSGEQMRQTPTPYTADADRASSTTSSGARYVGRGASFPGKTA